MSKEEDRRKIRSKYSIAYDVYNNGEKERMLLDVFLITVFISKHLKIH